MPLRDDIFLGMTQSLCTECLTLVVVTTVAKQGVFS